MIKQAKIMRALTLKQMNKTQFKLVNQHFFKSIEQSLRNGFFQKNSKNSCIKNMLIFTQNQNITFSNIIFANAQMLQSQLINKQLKLIEIIQIPILKKEGEQDYMILNKVLTQILSFLLYRYNVDQLLLINLNQPENQHQQIYYKSLLWRRYNYLKEIQLISKDLFKKNTNDIIETNSEKVLNIVQNISEIGSVLSGPISVIGDILQLIKKMNLSLITEQNFLAKFQFTLTLIHKNEKLKCKWPQQFWENNNS
ncbi:unnamed protein product [Paramecium octaurelia]|uniref:Uncharacterized protein n=1 Tax=Paramecium octaurelia TaxID=43137 RepID=A0A8S1YRW8_PAROT|nr:unnamed protein product [Paramecium octaurelia]